MKVESRVAERGATGEPAEGNEGSAFAARLALVAVGGVVVFGLVLRFWTRSELWFDEAQTVNIAHLPLSRLVDALRHDGAPPLYYVLLHFWERIFGTGDLATRSFSGVVAVATLPLGWYAGRRLGGRRVAWLTVIVLSASPYAIRFATEVRMYSLVMLLVLAGYLALRRMLERPSPLRIATVTVITALLFYTQYWSFYLVGVVALAAAWQLWRARGTPAARGPRTVLVALVLGGVLFAPWLGVLRYQLAHTGTPWGEPRLPWSGLGSAFLTFAGYFGGATHGEAYMLIVPLVVLPLLGIFGLARDRRRIELDLRTQPAVRWEAAAGFGSLIVGLGLAYVGGSAFEGRYAAIAYPLIILTFVFGLTAFADRRVQLGAVALVVALGFAGGLRNVTDHRTQSFQAAGVIRAEARPGDVVAYCPDQIAPDSSRLLRDVPGLRQLTFPDGGRPERVDWVDYLDRMRRASSTRFAARVARVAGTHRVFYVWSTGYRGLVGKCEAVVGALASQLGTNAQQKVVSDSEKFFESVGLTEYANR